MKLLVEKLDKKYCELYAWLIYSFTQSHTKPCTYQLEMGVISENNLLFHHAFNSVSNTGDFIKKVLLTTCVH